MPSSEMTMPIERSCKSMGLDDDGAGHLGRLPPIRAHRFRHQRLPTRLERLEYCELKFAKID